ncbi:hypothetical protein M9H77_30964 [Catharanthus roseus]|uniref:Uncharacterized protein n=1 Tax=Catharanthus roseus TaxID=4058 RepID=A0ACC0A1D6_CATRO|nr:hypothetical protein M9H77_30964 [Catharanthus roseus]
MVVNVKGTLKNKLEGFEDQRKASKLLSVLLEASNPTIDGSPSPTIAGRPLDWNRLEDNTLSCPVGLTYHCQSSSLCRWGFEALVSQVRGGRRGGLGGRGYYRPQEDFPRHEAWHEGNLYEDYGANPNVGEAYHGGYYGNQQGDKTLHKIKCKVPSFKGESDPNVFHDWE